MITDAVWPALYLTQSMSAWLCIAISVVLEGIIFWRLGGFKWWKALTATFIANVASTLIGVLLLFPIAGVWLEVLANMTYNSWLHLGSLNLLSWILTGLTATLLNAAIQAVSIWMCNLADWSKKLVISVLIANTVAVAIAYAVLFYFPQHIR